MHMPAVFVANEQDDHDLDTEKYLQLANDVLIDEQQTDEVEVNVLFVDEKSIAELNEKFMGKTGSTDVLSFPIDDGPPESGRFPDGGGTGPGDAGGSDPEEMVSLLGDVVICPAVAFKRAPGHAGTFEDELALLLVHGLLHLLGMDHVEDDEAVVMEARERELLQAFWHDLPDTAWASTEPKDE
jgi:probable rRNA maturation factor